MASVVDVGRAFSVCRCLRSLVAGHWSVTVAIAGRGHGLGASGLETVKDELERLGGSVL